MQLQTALTTRLHRPSRSIWELMFSRRQLMSEMWHLSNPNVAAQIWSNQTFTVLVMSFSPSYTVFQFASKILGIENWEEKKIFLACISPNKHNINAIMLLLLHWFCRFCKRVGQDSHSQRRRSLVSCNLQVFLRSCQAGIHCIIADNYCRFNKDPCRWVYLYMRDNMPAGRIINLTDAWTLTTSPNQFPVKHG